MSAPFPLKLKYRNPNHRHLKRQGIDPPEGTLVFAIGLSSKRGRSGGNSGNKDNSTTIRARMKSYWGNVLRG